MGRIYSVPFVRVACTTGMDLFEITATTLKPFCVHEIVLGQTSDFGDAAAEGLLLEFYRGASGFTSGSGGTTPTPVPHNTNDPAAGFSAEVNNTTLALGTLTRIRGEPFNIQAGYQYLPVPEDRVLFAPAEGFILRLSSGVGTAGPADSITLSGTIVIEEF